MQEFYGYQLKIYNEKVEIYKNKKLIETAEDVEKAKKIIIDIEMNKPN